MTKRLYQRRSNRLITVAVCLVGLLVGPLRATTPPLPGHSIAHSGPYSDVGPWQWEEVEGAICANGSPTGFAIQEAVASRQLVIFLQGGGACWDAQTCYTKPIAIQIESGVDGTQLTKRLRRQSPPFFDRQYAHNPFRHATQVFIPYCTGDAYQGNAVQVYQGRVTHHVGFKNMSLILRELKSRFSDVDNVVMMGSSAGGYGAVYNWGQAQDAFSPILVNIINDSGSHFPNPWLEERREQKWRKAWGLSETLPEDCLDCRDNFDAIVTHQAQRYPQSRGMILTYQTDFVLADYYHIPYGDVGDALKDLLRQRWDAEPNLRTLVIEGEGHILLSRPLTQSNEKTLFERLGDFLWN